MTKFGFTDKRNVIGSSAVDFIAYNKNNKELLVALHDNAYVYGGVEENVFKAFAIAPSKGRAYRAIKDKFGPALGNLGESKKVSLVDPSEVDEVVMASAPATPHWYRPRGPGGRFLSRAEREALESNTEAPVTSVGNSTGPHISATPERVVAQTFELRSNGEGRITSSNIEARSINATRNHDVVFVANGSDEEKTYHTQASSVDGARRNLDEALNALGLDARVVRITVHF